MKEITVRDICGDYALDIKLCDNSVFTLYFNSRQNALNVKRIMEVDGSVPNAATVCDMVEVVRCEKCIYEDTTNCPLCYIEKHTLQFINHDGAFYCGKGERKDSADAD